MNASIKKYQKITDYIYGIISIPENHRIFLDSFHIQRLRSILQIPTARYVFPSVNHSCFEHSLGTYFLSHKFITDLKNRQNELDINQNLINTISLCGLFNNIGTVPYLNSFKSFYQEKYDIEYNSKQKAYEIILKLIEDKGIDPECMTNKSDNENFDLNIIKNIFTNATNNSKFYEKIVFNPNTLIDCESFDNLNRDTFKYGINSLFDHTILMNSAYVMNDEIFYNHNDASSISHYYNSKYIVELKYYNHRVATAIELMIKDVFKLMDQYSPLIDIINDNNKYLYFFDCYIHNIKNIEKENKYIKEAKNILNNIDKRNLYTWVGEYYLPNDNDSEKYIKEFKEFNANTLIENKNKDDVKLNPDEIRIKKDIICLGPGSDPFNNILFYDNEYNTGKLKQEDVSKLLPKRYKYKIIKIFLTSKDNNKIKAAANALNNYKIRYKGYIDLYNPIEPKEKNIEIKTFELDEDMDNKDNQLDKKKDNQKGYNRFRDKLFSKKK